MKYNNCKEKIKAKESVKMKLFSEGIFDFLIIYGNKNQQLKEEQL
ncbi:hypothetical protein AB670_02403 [Chryseobacterium sp. MOF25P]|nr:MULTISPECIES: hypothetical protein [unclassified Chryseobacterium]OBW41181.1 hypothetical protein AB670_02403 [Chryseobacterium sp. MOF25P]OBW45246.1 hypothetical protein AB671_02653 [Chryseobacterium sp. BGARF1]